MKISELVEKLQQIQDEYGNLNIQVVRYIYEQSSLPSSAMGGGGGGWTTQWCGTIANLQISKKYPDQLEIWSTK